MSRRPSSTSVRRWCYEHWVNPDGTLTCYMCGATLDVERAPHCWEAEHETPRGLGGSDRPPNVKPCCAPTCEQEGVGHKEKTRVDVTRIARVKASVAKRLGFKRSANPMPGSKRSGWKQKYNRETGRWEAVRRDK